MRRLLIAPLVLLAGLAGGGLPAAGATTTMPRHWTGRIAADGSRFTIALNGSHITFTLHCRPIIHPSAFPIYGSVVGRGFRVHAASPSGNGHQTLVIGAFTVGRRTVRGTINNGCSTGTVRWRATAG